MAPTNFGELGRIAVIELSFPSIQTDISNIRRQAHPLQPWQDAVVFRYRRFADPSHVSYCGVHMRTDGCAGLGYKGCDQGRNNLAIRVRVILCARVNRHLVDPQGPHQKINK